MLKISIIIPYYKPLEYLKKCLAALHTNTLYPIHEVIIVNDGAPDSDALRQYIPTVVDQLNFKLVFVDRYENHGFVYTCNEGANHSSGDYLLFLNFDTVPQSGWLQALVTLLIEKPNCGVLGSRLLYPEVNWIQHVGGAFDKKGNPCHIYKGQPAFLPFLSRNRSLQWVTGAALMISKKDFNAVDGFDSTFITSSEDVDLCFKVRFQLGKEVWLAADSILYHYTDVTGASSQNIARTHPLLLSRWQDKIVCDEESIWEMDGFAPEFVELLENCGISKDFGFLTMMLQQLQLASLEQQRQYVKTYGKQFFLADLKSLSETFPFYHPNKWKDLSLHHESQQTSSGSLNRMIIQQLTGLLSNTQLTHSEKESLFSQLTTELNALHFFTILYNLASLMAVQGEKDIARQFFSFLSRYALNANESLAGKAYFKLAELCEDMEQKKEYLYLCLKWIPEHHAARRCVESIIQNELQNVKMIQQLADIPTGATVALYGAGTAGKNMLKIIKKFRPDLVIDCFVDLYCQGKIDDIPIVLTSFFLERKTSGDFPLVLITSMAWREIEVLLKSNKINNYLVVPSRFLVPSGIQNLIQNTTLDPRLNTLSYDLFSAVDRQLYAQSLQAACDLLAQPSDRNLFRSLIGATGSCVSRLEEVTAFYYHNTLKKQYFDFIDYGNVKTIIEGGVADGGDTIAFLKAAPEGCHIYGFEPNINDYRVGRYKPQLEKSDHVSIVDFGLWSKPGELYFSISGLSSQVIEQLPEGVASHQFQKIKVISIDHWVAQNNIKKVDLIKLDIEGAELEALKGAIETLKRDRPQLAICLYHKKEDFFQIPLFLDRVLVDYEYRLGHYTAGSTETVWYALPRG